MLGCDKTYLINLAHRTDRLRVAKTQFAKAGIVDYTVFNAIDAKKLNIKGVQEENQGLIGCFLSHLFILQEAMMNKYTSIAVFEDDVIIVNDFKIKYHQALGQIPDKWQMLYLGYYERTGSSKIRLSENITLPKDTWGTHAYIVRGDGIKIMYNNLQIIKTHIDIQISREIAPKMYTYCIHPALCNQSGIKSDIK